MAFGAKISLHVDTSNKDTFATEIQNYVDSATKTPIQIKNIKIKLDPVQLTKDINSNLSAGGGIVVDLKSINAEPAIAKLRQDISNMLQGLTFGGMKGFLSGGSTSGNTGGSHKKTAEEIKQATESAIAFNSQQKILLATVNKVSRVASTLGSDMSNGMSKMDNTTFNNKIKESIAWLQKFYAMVQTKTVMSTDDLSDFLMQGESLYSDVITARDDSRIVQNPVQIEQRIATLTGQTQRFISSNPKAYMLYKSELDGILSSLKEIDATSPSAKEQLDNLKLSLTHVNNATRQGGILGDTFFGKISKGWTKFLGWSIVTRSMMLAVKALKTMITNVKALDDAMVELKKVTDLSASSYDKFLDKATSIAQSRGVSIVDAVNSTADFARLGYNVEDSTYLAEAALVYKNVGDGIADIDEATNSIISTIKAFEQTGIAAKDAMSIVDKFNNVGNKFAISSAGIGAALQKSASSLVAANNSLDESIALITAANSVVQNPEVVGTAMKTISMYLRAAKTEAEEAGESTDGMANSVSELRSELFKLTDGQVDIMIDSDTFKSTYEIMRELSKVWKDISDVDQANIVELIGGKRNATVITSLLSNFKDAEASLYESQNSSGSALAENEKALDSISGKLKLIQSQFEEISRNLIDSGTVKFFLDITHFLSQVLNFLTKIPGLLSIIMVSITAIRTIRQKATLESTASSLIDLASTGDKITKNELLAASITKLNQKNKELLATTLLNNAADDEEARNRAEEIIQTYNLRAAKEALNDEDKKSLGIKGALMNSVSWIGVAISAITIVAQIVSGISQEAARIREEQIELGKEATEEAKSLDGLIAQYRKLGEDGKFDNSDRQEARTIHEQIVELIGEEASEIDIANSKYKDQLDLLQDIQAKNAEKNKGSLIDALDSAEKELNKPFSYYSGIGSGLADEHIDGKYESTHIAELLESVGMGEYRRQSLGNGKKTAKGNAFYIDDTNIDSIIQSYEDMVKLKEIMANQYEDEIRAGGALYDFYTDLTNKINDMSAAVSQYKEALSNYNTNEAVILFHKKMFEGIEELPAEFKELTFATIENEEQLVALMAAMLQMDGISDDIKYNIIGLAKTNYPEMSEAIDNATAKFVRGKIATGEFKGSLSAVASQCGMATKDLATMILKMINLNETKLNLSQQISEILKLRAAMDMSDIKGSDIYDAGGKWIGKDKYLLDGKEYTYNEAIRKVAYDKTMEEINKLGNGNTGGDTPPYSPTDDTKDKNKDKPSYEDPTDAIINRINLRSKELEQQEEQIQNAIEIAGLEKDYKKQISLTNDKLATQKKRLDSLKTANDEIHQMAEDLRNSTPGWDEESWFNSQGQATEAYNNFIKERIDAGASKEEIESIKNQFETISKIKKAWVDNDEEIVSLNQEIIKGEKDTLNIASDIFDEIDRIVNRHTEELQERADDYDILINQNQALIDGEEKFYEAQKKIRDAQKDISNELAASKKLANWIDKDTRELLFNDGDYSNLSEKLKTIQDDIQTEFTWYQEEIGKLTEDNWYLEEAITKEYERRLESKQREYEIARAELDIAKKQSELNNILAEKNVTMVIGGQLQQVADFSKVKEATEELTELESDLADIRRDSEQKSILAKKQADNDNLSSEKAAIENRIRMIEEQTTKMKRAIEDFVNPLQDLASMIEALTDMKIPGIENSSNKLSSYMSKDYNNSQSEVQSEQQYVSSQANSSYGGYSFYLPNSYNQIVKVNPDGKAPAGLKAGDVVLTGGGAYRVNDVHKDGSYSSGQMDTIDYSKVSGYASGTSHALAGWHKVNEDGYETFMTRDGILHDFTGGETVFSAKQTKSLFDISKTNTPDVLKALSTLPSILPTHRDSQSGTSQSFGDIIINSPRDYDDFLWQLSKRIGSKVKK